MTTTQSATTSQVLHVEMTVNGQPISEEVESRVTLADFLRHQVGLTGTHLGCEHGVCGSCTVVLDGDAVRSCLLFAVQADGANITTIEGLAAADGTMHPIQQAFLESHSFQCGFCTPGFVMTVYELLTKEPQIPTEEIRPALGGNLCRCTGYQSIVAGVELAKQKLANPSASVAV
jgi:carbon-monoxide dehydrogenase small subunit